MQSFRPNRSKAAKPASDEGYSKGRALIDVQRCMPGDNWLVFRFDQRRALSCARVEKGVGTKWELICS